MYRIIAILLFWLLCSGFGGQKPPLGAQLNRSHPLTQGLLGAWLLNEGGGGVLNNLANGSRGGLTKSGAFTMRPDGAYSAGGYGYVLNNAINITNYGMSLVGIIIIPDTIASNKTMCGIGDKTAPVNDYLALSIATNKVPYVQINQTGSISINCIKAVKPGIPQVFGASNYSSALHYAYLNGNLEATSTNDAGAWLTDLDSLNLCVGGSGAAFTGGLVQAVFVWNRPLTGAEHQSLSDSPYAMFNSPILSKPYLNYAPSSTPSTAPGIPTKRQNMLMGYDKRGNPIIAYEPKPLGAVQ